MNKINFLNRSAFVVASACLGLACATNQPAANTASPSPPAVASATQQPAQNPAASPAAEAGIGRRVTLEEAPAQNPAASPAQNPAVSPAAEANLEDQIPRVTVDQLKQWMAAHQAVIIDVRSPEAYQTAHIKGSISLPVNKIQAGEYKGLPREKHIVAYCT